jgi:transcription initiation factor IIE alpha subunit
MRYTKSAVNKVMQEVFGKDVLPVTTLLNKHEEISEIKLAELMRVEVNEARRVLYKLYHENLVSFKKRKILSMVGIPIIGHSIILVLELCFKRQ